jgi:hypothetical protein
MGRKAEITFDDVQKAVLVLGEMGDCINAGTIRRYLGKGSPNTIQIHLNILKEDKESEFKEDGFSEVPKKVQLKFEQIYSELRFLAGMELKNIQQVHERQLNEIRGQLKVYQDYTIEVDQKVEFLEKENDELRAQLLLSTALPEQLDKLITKLALDTADKSAVLTQKLLSGSSKSAKSSH